MSVRVGSRDRSLAARFMAKVRRMPGRGGCWIWTGSATSEGYGVIHVGGRGAVRRRAEAGRLSLEWKIGRRLRGFERAMRLCGNPRCVNPAHLRAGTAKSVNERTRLSGHRPETRGSLNGNAILTERKVREILDALRVGVLPRRRIARNFGVSLSAIQAIHKGRRWGHVRRPGTGRGTRV